MPASLELRALSARLGGSLALPMSRAYILAMALFVCALLSKTVTASLPAALLLVLWWKRGRLSRRDVWPLAPMFVLGIALGLLTSYLERSHVRAVGPDWEFSAAQRVLIAGRAVWFYAGKLLWPWPTVFVYPRWEVDAESALQWTFVAAAVGLVAGAWVLRDRAGRGVVTAVLFFGGTLLPALGFVNVYPMRFSFVADHFQYLASIGVIVLPVAGVASRLGRRRGAILAGAVLAVLVALTWRQGGAYANAETLWQDTLSKNPRAWIARANLGDAWLRRAAEARRLGDMAEAERLLGDAEQMFRSVAIDRPCDAAPVMQLALVYEQRGQVDAALDWLTRAAHADPGSPEPHFLRGRLLASRRHIPEAIASYEAALRLHPAHVPAHVNLGALLVATGRRDDALRHYHAAIDIDPGAAFAHVNLANLLFEQGEYAAAAEHYGRAMALEPDLPQVAQRLDEARRRAAGK